MVNNAKETKTIAYYNQGADVWVKEHGGDNGPSYWLEEMEWFHRLLPKGKVLEIGSGSGRDAAALISMGYDYFGIDASEGLLGVARRRNPEARFELMDVEELRLPEDNFDGFWAAASLLHIPKEKIDNVLVNIKKVVKSSGVGFISLKKGEGEKEEKSTGRWFSYYSQEGFRDILERNSFAIEGIRIRQDRNVIWLGYFVKVRK